MKFKLSGRQRRNYFIYLCFFISAVVIFSYFPLAFSQDQANDYVQKFAIWLEANSNPVTGLPYSHVGDERFRHWTITYDAAIVALAYIAAGEIPEAKKIIDFYISRPEIRRLGGIIEAISYYDNIQGEDWSVRTGANLWIGIASIQLYFKTGESRYLEFAKGIADFVISLQNNNKNDSNFGAIPVGPAGGDSVAGDQHFDYDIHKPSFNQIYATEINLDAYSLFQHLYKTTHTKKYSILATRCLNWLKKNAWNKAEHRFNRGYRDEIVASDVQSWAISALGIKVLDGFEMGLAEGIAKFVEENCLSNVEYISPDKNKIIVTGVDFIDKKRASKLGRMPLVSFEWSFQFVNAYLRLEKDFMAAGKIEIAGQYREKRKRLMQSLLLAASNTSEVLAYPYATEPNAIIGHEYLTPKEGNFSAIAGAYAILALKCFDPLVVDSKAQ